MYTDNPVRGSYNEESYSSREIGYYIYIISIYIVYIIYKQLYQSRYITIPSYIYIYKDTPLYIHNHI